MKGGALTSAAAQPYISLVTGGTSPTGGANTSPVSIAVGKYADGVKAIVTDKKDISYSGAAG
jgi:hypothetical protein